VLELTAATRAGHLARMAEDVLDVLIIGGGITGAGVALDAVTRGLSVGLVERDDLAAGTSGRSSRLIHGGARYLRRAEVGIVRESLRERELLRRLAPHLIRPVGFLIPTRRLRGRAIMGFGLALYGVVAAGLRGTPHRRIGREEMARLAPTLRWRTGGYVSFDCRTDDARLTLEVARTAAARGALLATHAGVEEIGGPAAVRRALVRDQIDGGALEIRARTVVNATGVWADRLGGIPDGHRRPLRPSKGVHVVLPRHRLPIGAAAMVPSVAGSEGFVFAIPWGPRVYAGTTDTPYHGGLEEPPVEDEDVDVVMASLDRAFGGDLSPTDVVASWAGIRPLLRSGTEATRDLSRRHAVWEGPPGVVTVTGGKLTTYRAMAEEVADLVCRRLGRGGASRTAQVALGLTRPLLPELGRGATEAERMGLSPDAGRRLVGRYGDDWPEALTMIRDDPGLGDPLVEGLPVLRVEVEMARRRELALTHEDVLLRRTRLAAMDAAAAASVSGRTPTPRR
jgi:glycerol-3-phosphate dehydrogenase